jgi:putative transcriptional regulator
MSKRAINRIKVVLAEKERSNKWLAEKLNKNESTISHWCRNVSQPSAETYVSIARLLDVEVGELFVSVKTRIKSNV